MSRLPRLSLFALLAIMALPSAAKQDPAPVRQIVEDFLRIQTKGLPGRITIEVADIDPQNNLAPCSVLEPSLASGSRAWGKTTVAVRCRAEGGWNLYVSAKVSVVGDYLVTARALVPGQTITANDFVRQSGDLADLPPGTVIDPAQALDKTLTMGIAAGRPLRGDMLRQPYAVRQGQSVKVISSGSGFRVSTEALALNNATPGQIAQVRTSSGQTLSGIARIGGIIDMSH